MQVKETKEASAEKLIKRLCAIWGIETKWARTEEKQIAKELERRGIVEAEKLISELNKI